MRKYSTAIPFVVGGIEGQMQRTASDTVHGNKEVPSDTAASDGFLIHGHLTGFPIDKIGTQKVYDDVTLFLKSPDIVLPACAFPTPYQG